jgi:hypothetical protein
MREMQNGMRVMVDTIAGLDRKERQGRIALLQAMGAAIKAYLEG